MTTHGMIHSHSALQKYRQCPQAFYRLKVLKDIKDVMGAAADYGDKVHKAIEARVKSDVALPPEFRQYEPLCQYIVTIPGTHHCELKLGMNDRGEGRTFFAKGPTAGGDNWLRGIIDFLAINGSHGTIIDYKTGKYRGDDGQPAICSALAFANFPELETITARFLYLPESYIAKYVYTRQGFSELIAPVQRTDIEIEWSHTSNAWPTRPSGLCGWCPVGNSGQCADAQKRKR